MTVPPTLTSLWAPGGQGVCAAPDQAEQQAAVGTHCQPKRLLLHCRVSVDFSTAVDHNHLFFSPGRNSHFNMSKEKITLLDIIIYLVYVFTR